MKKLLIFFLLTISTSLFAAEGGYSDSSGTSLVSKAPEKAKSSKKSEPFEFPENFFGVGFSFGGTLLNNAQNGNNIVQNIYFPMNFDKNFRLEFELGYLSTERTTQKEIGENKFEDVTEETFRLRIGMGMFYIYPKDQISIYLGSRIGLYRYDIDGVTEEKNVDETKPYISGVIGIEYHITQYLTIGAEVQLEYANLEGEKDSEPSMIQTLNQLTLRWYF